MIDTHQSRRLDERRLWSVHVQQLFQTLGIGDRTAAQDITESLAVFCQHHTHMPKHALSLLMARSFCAAGDTEAAGRILHHDGAHRPHAASWLEVLSAGYPFPELYPLFSARALRPQRFASTGTLWVLDFDKIRLTEADRHELILFQTVRVLTEQVSNVWKQSNGQGTLGVKGFARLTRFVRGRQTSRRMLCHIRDVLALRARKNGWSSTPDVLILGKTN
jgi:hypothetical protein